MATCRASCIWTEPGNQSGLTLLEVLVALAVIAIALAAVIRATGQTAGNVGYLQEKTLAFWVAENLFTEMRLADTWPELGVQQGSAPMGGEEFRWRAEVLATDDPDLRRVNITASVDGGSGPAATLSGFLGRTRAETDSP